MKNVVISEKQLENLITRMSESEQGGSYMAKQQLYTIAVMAYNMWEKLDEGEQLDDWMESKIAQSEQSISSVVKSYMYDDLTGDENNTSNGVNLDDLIIGK